MYSGYWELGSHSATCQLLHATLKSTEFCFGRLWWRSAAPSTSYTCHFTPFQSNYPCDGMHCNEFWFRPKLWEKWFR